MSKLLAFILGTLLGSIFSIVTMISFQIDNKKRKNQD